MFCSRCGAELPHAARFCERCGHQVEFDAPTAPEHGVDRRVVAGGVALVVIVAVVAVLIISGVFENDDSEKTAARPPASPGTATSEAPTPAATESATATATETASAAQSARARVQGTCGRNGVGGDCHLSVREEPASSSRELERLNEGDPLRISCQVRGERVYSSALGGSSTVWSKTTSDGYVANVYLAGPRLNPRRLTLPRC
jgi:hypothetical protein